MSGIVTDEMLAAVKSEELGTIEEANAAKEEQVRDPSKPRTFQREASRRTVDLWIDESLPIPVQLDIDNLSPTSVFAVPYGEITGNIETQEFTLDEEKLKGMVFQMPAKNLPGKRLYTVKAFHEDGTLVQLPFESQINNTAGGELEDAIGIRRYQRKGLLVLIDWNTLMPVYCAAFECWAAAMRPELVDRFPQHQAAVGTGFCSVRHAQHTMPNRFSQAAEILGAFGKDATTSRVWGT